jgi:hypothetical protein
VQAGASPSHAATWRSAGHGENNGQALQMSALLPLAKESGANADLAAKETKKRPLAISKNPFCRNGKAQRG